MDINHADILKNILMNLLLILRRNRNLSRKDIKLFLSLRVITKYAKGTSSKNEKDF